MANAPRKRSAKASPARPRTFRLHSYFSDKAVGTIVGLRSKGYALETIGGK
ncbi:MAG TPA: hypothetical protein VII68_03240 [Casimicrobiaceae bacterium]|jgi:3-dehydroquinate dehydratase